MLYIVGKINRDNYLEWEFMGIFEEESDAVQACHDDRHFVGPVELNEELPEEQKVWVGSYYPITLKNVT